MEKRAGKNKQFNKQKNSYIDIKNCWCGSSKLKKFSEWYVKCEECDTLINSPRLDEEYFNGNDDNEDIYGKRYWTEYQTEKYGYSNIFERTRLDLTERCIYWLNEILKYKLPPAKTLELGCGHGGLVALMTKAGFDASGAELNDWVVNYAKKSFNINVLKGKIEELDIEDESLDFIILMDVLEHFTEPLKSMQIISNSLNKEGLVIIQTPCYADPTLDFKYLQENNQEFLGQMKSQEHLYLFTMSGLKLLLNRTGFKHVYIEPAIFPYDMFVIAGKTPMKTNSNDEIQGFLEKTSEGRFIQALMDLFNKQQDLQSYLRECEADRAARLEVINRINKQLQESEADRAARLEVINRLNKQLEESESNRAADLELINNLSKQLEELEIKLVVQSQLIDQLKKQLAQSEEGRADQIKKEISFKEQIKTLKMELSKYEDEGNATLKGRLIRMIKKW